MAANQPAVSVTDEYLPLFQDLVERLQAAEWFQDGWAGGSWANGGRNSGVTIYRPRWETGNALHLETWIGNADVKRGTVVVALHVETSHEKTGIKRTDFHKLFLERCGPTVAAWEGYRVHPTYAMEPLRGTFAYTKDGLSALLQREFERMAALAPALDGIVTDLRSS